MLGGDAAVFSLLLSLTRLHHIEVQGWLIDVFARLITACLELPDCGTVAPHLPKLSQAIHEYAKRGRSSVIKAQAAEVFLRLLLLGDKCECDLEKMAPASHLDTVAEQLSRTQSKVRLIQKILLSWAPLRSTWALCSPRWLQRRPCALMCTKLVVVKLQQES